MKCFLMIWLAAMTPAIINAQDCTVNAGVEDTVCYTENFTLDATVGGILNANPNYKWEQTGGPILTIGSPSGSLNTSVTGVPVSGGVFTFKFSATCNNGITSTDIVTITIRRQVIADAGDPQQVFCSVSGQLMNATSPPTTDFTGVWELVSGSNALAIVGSNDSKAAVTITPAATPHLETAVYQWKVTDNTTQCVATDQVTTKIINIPTNPDAYSVGRATKIDASHYAITTNSCYSEPAGQNVALLINPLGNYYYPGGPDETILKGVWSLVSKPSGAPDPTITNEGYSAQYSAQGLHAGEYVFKWTLSAPPCITTELICTVTVPEVNNTASVTKPIGYTIFDNPVTALYLCDPSAGTTPFTHTFDFSPFLPEGHLAEGEQISWRPFYGNDVFNTTVINPTSLKPSFQGLLGHVATYTYANTNYYVYVYTITNTITGCSLEGQIPIWVGAPSQFEILNENATVLPCGTTEFVMEYHVEGAFNDGSPSASPDIRFLQEKTPPGAASPEIIVLPGEEINGSIRTGKIRISNLTTTGTYSYMLEYGTDKYCGANRKPLTINVSIPPPPANAGSPQNLACGVTSTQLAGSDTKGASLLWTQVSGPSTAVIANNRSQIADVSSLVPGTYTFRYSLQGVGTCLVKSFDADVQVFVTPPEDVAVAIAPADFTACSGSQVTLRANTPGPGQTGRWTVTPTGPLLDNPASPTAKIIDGLVIGTDYTFTWTVSSPCSSASDNVTVSVSDNAGPNVANAGNDLCLTEEVTSITLNGNQPDPNSIGSWTVYEGPATIENSSSPVTNANITTPGTPGEYQFIYTIISTTGCGQSTDTVRVSVASQPPSIANAGADINNCSTTGQVSLEALQPTGGTGTWTQVGGPAGALIADPNNPKTSVTNLVAGASYKFEWHVVSGEVCSINNKDVVVVNALRPPTLEVKDPPANCASVGIDLTAPAITPSRDPGILSYWKDAAGTIPLSNPEKVTIFGTYYIQLTGSNDCQTVPKGVLAYIIPSATAANISTTTTFDATRTNATFTASTNVSNPTFKWYSDASLTDLLYTGNPYSLAVATHPPGLFVTVGGSGLCENLPGQALVIDLAELPLTLISFTGKCIEQNNELKWITENEVNVCCFELERGTDGIHFSKITNVPAKGAGRNTYTFTDQDVADNYHYRYYYRLKMKDIDGSFTYSNVVYLSNASLAKISYYPNPFQSTITVDILLERMSDLQIQLISIDGKTLYRQKQSNLSQGRHTIQIKELGGLSRGLYLLKIVQGDKVTVQRVLKQ